MTSPGTIRLIAIARLRTATLIHYVNAEKVGLNSDVERASGEAQRNEANKVLQQLRGLPLEPEERQKINTGSGSWYCKLDDRNIM